jgi:hypothetical protein
MIIPTRPGGSHCSICRAISPSGSRPRYGPRRAPSVINQGAVFGGLVPPVLVYFATSYNFGFAISMLVSTVIAAASVVISLLLSPETETKGKVLVPDLVVV